MSGALFFHFTKLGIVFDGDAVLFIYAAITFVCCLILLIKYNGQLTIGNKQKPIGNKQ
jgi:hypothetical protein